MRANFGLHNGTEAKQEEPTEDQPEEEIEAFEELEEMTEEGDFE